MKLVKQLQRGSEMKSMCGIGTTNGAASSGCATRKAIATNFQSNPTGMVIASDGNDQINSLGGDDVIVAEAGRADVSAGAREDVVGSARDDRMWRRTRTAIINSCKAVNDETNHAWREAA